MNTRIGLHALAVLLIATLLGSCGGTQVASGGTGGTGISMGTVTGFGSIFVNGVEFDTNATGYYEDGALSGSSVETNVKLGMVVTVRGVLGQTTGTAEEVEYRKKILGPVSTAYSAGTIVILGQSVNVHSSTVFDGTNMNAVTVTGPADLTVNDMVEVSGYSEPGGVRATRIEALGRAWTVGDEVELRGYVAEKLQSENLKIGAQEIEGNTAGIGKGQYVYASGTLAAGILQAATLLPEPDGFIGGEDGDEAEIEGVITYLNGENLIIEGQPIRLTSTTEYADNLGQLSEGMRVEVEGRLDNGVLVAKQVEAEDEGTLELIGDVQSKATDSFKIMGKTVVFSSNTVVDNKAVFFEQLQEGDWLKVDAYPSGDVVVAAQVEVFSDPPDLPVYEVEGPVDQGSVDTDTFSIAGITVNSTNATGPGGGIAEGQPLEVIGSFDETTGIFTAESIAYSD